MTIQDLFDEAYEDTNTSTANYPYSKALKKFNDIYKEVYRMIVTVQEDYFWTYWNTDIEEGYREYTIEREQTSYVDDQGNTVYVPGIAKVKKIYILHEDSSKEEVKQLSSLEESIGEKGYVLKDNHIILNRTPTETIEGGLQLEGIQAINNISGTLNEINVEDVVFPGHPDLSDFYKVIMIGLKYELREHKQDFEKADRAKSRYEEELEKMKRYITQRVQDIYYSDVQK